MKTITIITPSNIELEYRLAGVGSRLAAFIIDYLLQVLMSLLVVFGIMYGIDYALLGNDVSGVALGISMVSVFVIQTGYFIVMELVTNGQSVGKRIFGLRVIRDNGQPIGFTQSLVRGLLRSSLDMLYVGLFVIMFSKRCKRLGDMAAGTVVVAERRGVQDDSFIAGENQIV
ncbi:MAG: RDD family protein [Defluviitaleaceae bacterium]|nr:RDD family protein [Defluviitaleaceae bacterium]